ncbi:hypothetical protein VTI74DRAFT_8691 [Chaetomium olivicolor]
MHSFTASLKWLPIWPQAKRWRIPFSAAPLDVRKRPLIFAMDTLAQEQPSSCGLHIGHGRRCSCKGGLGCGGGTNTCGARRARLMFLGELAARTARRTRAAAVRPLPVATGFGGSISPGSIPLPSSL